MVKKHKKKEKLLKITSWNINSVRMRIPLLRKLATEEKPDIICLQETKVSDHLFPIKEIEEMGYDHIIFRGDKGYNGVAIISKIPLTSVEKHHIAGIDDARHIAATLPNGIRLHNFYIPAGGDEPDVKINDKFKHKIDFIDYITTWLPKKNGTNSAILVGDFNIAPLENDVWSHKQLLKVVSHTPIEVEKLTKFQQTLGFIDSARYFIPESDKCYSWWSYRNRDWQKSNRGRRLDHIWVTPDLKPILKEYKTLIEARSWDRPSDHVPISLHLLA